MHIRKQEFKRLNSAESLVESLFPQFGINKKQEVTRLLYEISKRERILPLNIIKDMRFNNYDSLKKQLLQRRYPYSFLNARDIKPYLPKIELKTSDCFDVGQKEFTPKNIFIETQAKNSFLARRFKDLFPKARVSEIEFLKSYVCRKTFPLPVGERVKGEGNKIENYNHRKDTGFLVNERYDFFKKCPCTKNAIGCGYHIFNLGFGCIFDCTYCYLQDYTNMPGIILPVNIDSFFDKFSRYKKTGMRIGTGEFCDSLALDRITEYSAAIVQFFRKQKGVIFEFKTKSAEISSLLKLNHRGNIVISWSLNPQKIINENEYFTVSLKQRLDAASKCIEAGYKVGFHFDPVIYFDGWEKEYGLVIEKLFSKVKPEYIAWISIGTFRFGRELKQIIERRFPENRILDEELLLGYDGKLRYPYELRHSIYKEMLKMLFKRSKKVKISLCMEQTSMWKDLNYLR